MTLIGPDSQEARRIDAALSEWRQGDAALEERWFTHVAEPALALTVESEQAGEGLQAITSAVEGLVVVSQTCDIVRSCIARPFVEVAPLVRVTDDVLHQVEKGRRPAYAFVPALAGRKLVADLDRIMTVEKSVVASWTRTPGCTADHEVRAFALALARKRARFAFPDDFTELTRKLQGRLQRKHDKDTAEGRALRALREIRVKAEPSWRAEQVEITFLFIRDDHASDFEGRPWHEYLEHWLALLPPSGRFHIVEGHVVALDHLTARDYVESDPLDLDHLSSRATTT